MARYIINEAGEKVKVSGTNYIPPCLAKTAERKATKVQSIPVTETVQAYNETTHKVDAENDNPLS